MAREALRALEETPASGLVRVGRNVARAVSDPRELVRSARRQPTMSLGIAIITTMVLLSLASPILIDLFGAAPPNKTHMDDRFVAPGASYWFGSDAFGRDVFSRSLDGGKVSLFIGFTVAVVTMGVGSILGALTGYFRPVDAVLMRFMDGLMAMPALLLAIGLMMLLEAGVWTVITAIVIVDTPSMTRIARSQVLSLREQVFVESARAIGANSIRVLGRHIIPNLIAPVIIFGTLVAAQAILIEAYLSFLGAGVPPASQATWGNVMAEGRSFITKAMWVIFFPGLFLAIAVTSINLMGDGLRDVLDPKLRRRL